MRFGSLFSGIGGMDLGLEWAGMECAWQVEIEPYCIKVLERHWPQVKRYGDIKQINWEEIEKVDLICGGFPCQPFSVAGKRRGAADDRNLWPEMLRAVRGLRPSWVLGENVPGIGDYLDTICADLEAEAYEVLPLEIPAAAFGAWHLRYRTFIVAHTHEAGQPNGTRLPGQAEQTGRKVASADIDGKQEKWPAITWTERVSWETEPEMGRVVHGLSRPVDRLVRRRVAALGNAVVPQVAEWLAERILEADAALAGKEANGG